MRRSDGGGDVERLADTERLVETVQSGDVLFCARPSLIQSLAHAVGDEWRHCGIVADVDGQRCIIEASLAGVGVRPVGSLPETYDRIGVARLGAATAEGVAARAVASAEQQGFRFPPQLLVGLGLTACARRWGVSSDAKHMRPVVRWARSMEESTHLASCTTFASRLIGMERIAGSGPEMPCVVAERRPLPRVLLGLAMPTDLWWSPVFVERFDVSVAEDQTTTLREWLS